MKFANLLVKELRELINPQMIIGLVISVVMLTMMGNFMGTAMDKAVSGEQEAYICDEDKTDFTREIIDKVSGMENVKLHETELNGQTYQELINNLGAESVIIIPEGFTEKAFDDDDATDIELVNHLKSISISSTISGTMSENIVSSLKNTACNILLEQKYGVNEKDIEKVKNPVTVKSITVVGEKSAEVDSETLVGMATSQGIIVPLVVFIMVIFAAQMIVSAISTEKIDKTLETLLSAPVSRMSVLGAKMLAAAIMAIINAVVYMFGFSSYMGKMMTGTGISPDTLGSAVEQTNTISSAMQELGLQMSASDYVLLGMQMFMTILIALSISLMLGVLVNDPKAAQTVITPVMLMAMIPYLVSMFSDVSELPILLKIFMWIIPFTHTFNATKNILFNNMGEFWAGFAYQFVFFAGCMFLATRLFASDKIFTVSLDFGGKSRKKTKSNN